MSEREWGRRLRFLWLTSSTRVPPPCCWAKNQPLVARKGQRQGRKEKKRSWWEEAQIVRSSPNNSLSRVETKKDKGAIHGSNGAARSTKIVAVVKNFDTCTGEKHRRRRLRRWRRRVVKGEKRIKFLREGPNLRSQILNALFTFRWIYGHSLRRKKNCILDANWITVPYQSNLLRSRMQWGLHCGSEISIKIIKFMICFIKSSRKWIDMRILWRMWF